MPGKRIRGGVWKNTRNKKGFNKSTGAYAYRESGDRYFVLTAVHNSKTRVYESPKAAMRDGWYLVEAGS